MSRDALYAAGLRKLALYQRPSPAEARELRRRRLPDGDYPVLTKADIARRPPFHPSDPRIA